MNPEIELCSQLDSLLHRWDPRFKTAAFILIAAASAVVHSLYAAAIAFVISLIALLIGRLPLRVLAARLGIIQVFLVPCLVVLPFTTPGVPLVEGYAASREGFEFALLLYLRASTIVGFSIALIYTTPMNRLLQALEALYCPKVLVQITILTFRYIHTLSAEFVRIRCALSVRAFENRASMRVYQTWANVVGMTLVQSLERTERVRRAMQCRGYNGRLQRLHSFHVSPYDAIKMIVSIGCVILVVYVDFMFGANH